MTAAKPDTFKTLWINPATRAPAPRRASIVTASPQVGAQALVALTALGWCVTLVADAAELAVQLMKGDRPGLIVADHALPVMDGERLVQALAADMRFRAIRVLLVNRDIGVIAQIAELQPEWGPCPVDVGQCRSRGKPDSGLESQRVPR